ncbi:IS3 family transposase [Crocinitomix catalasitica]|nr:IS3 family transposase [Crocinitomix catalasitica]
MVYQTIGISKQAVHQYDKRQETFNAQMIQLVHEVDELRREHPGCGVEKMYYTLKPDFIGRDRFIECMIELGYRVKKKKNFRRTTFASSIYYSNLIKGLEVDRPSMIWQSDITYIRIGEKFYYAVFIIDVYTKKIVGHNVSDNMRAEANIKALKMAVKHHKAPLYHHSDRGSQYTYKDYIGLLRENGCKISMAITAQDNAYAERINKTIKEEYLDYWKPESFSQLRSFVKKAVEQYNLVRPHNHLRKLSPDKFETKWKETPNNLKPKLTIFNNQKTVNLYQGRTRRQREESES